MIETKEIDIEGTLYLVAYCTQCETTKYVSSFPAEMDICYSCAVERTKLIKAEKRILKDVKLTIPIKPVYKL